MNFIIDLLTDYSAQMPFKIQNWYECPISCICLTPLNIFACFYSTEISNSELQSHKLHAHKQTAAPLVLRRFDRQFKWNEQRDIARGNIFDIDAFLWNYKTLVQILFHVIYYWFHVCIWIANHITQIYTDTRIWSTQTRVICANAWDDVGGWWYKRGHMSDGTIFLGVQFSTKQWCHIHTVQFHQYCDKTNYEPKSLHTKAIPILFCLSPGFRVFFSGHTRIKVVLLDSRLILWMSIEYSIKAIWMITSNMQFFVNQC